MSTLSNTKEDFLIGVLGIRNHAKRLIDLFESSSKIRKVLAYHPSKVKTNENFYITNSFEEILSCDAVVISSPTKTHFQYLEKLSCYKGYIFLEKPAVSNFNEERLIKKLPIDLLSKLYVNYNFLFSDLYEKIKEIINSNILGEIVDFRIESCHGLAYKKEYKNSWRSNALFGVAEVVSVHYLNMLLHLFDLNDLKNVKILGKNISKSGKGYDTVNIFNLNSNNLNFSILCSYASPFIISFKIIGSNGVMQYDGENFTIRHPRDTYDENKRFKKPPIKYQTHICFKKSWSESLKKSVNFFINHLYLNKRFSREYLEKSLCSMKLFYPEEN